MGARSASQPKGDASSVLLLPGLGGFLEALQRVFSDLSLAMGFRIRLYYFQTSREIYASKDFFMPTERQEGSITWLDGQASTEIRRVGALGFRRREKTEQDQIRESFIKAG